MTAAVHTQQERPLPLAALPFRLKSGGRVPYLEANVRSGSQVLTVTFWRGTAEFSAVAELMEQYRELERRVGGVEGERDAAVEQAGRLKDELHRKDCKIAEQERRLTRGKAPKDV